MKLNVKLNWKTIEDLGFELCEAHPDVDPLTVRFTQMHEWITQLPGFEDDPKKSNEAILEAVQMAWLEEYKEMLEEEGK